MSTPAEAVGEIITNFQSLEMMLRVVLNEKVGPPYTGTPLVRLQPGDVVSTSYLTNYDSMRLLINRMNKLLREHGRSERIDKDKQLRNLRDAFAHGRIIPPSEDSSPYTLISFHQPKDDLVEVADVMVLTDEKLEELGRLGREEWEKVIALGRELGVRFAL